MFRRSGIVDGGGDTFSSAVDALCRAHEDEIQRLKRIVRDLRDDLERTRDNLASEKMLREECEERISYLESRCRMASDISRNVWQNARMIRSQQSEPGVSYVRKTQSAREYEEYPRERLYGDDVFGDDPRVSHRRYGSYDGSDPCPPVSYTDRYDYNPENRDPTKAFETPYDRPLPSSKQYRDVNNGTLSRAQQTSQSYKRSVRFQTPDQNPTGNRTLNVRDDEDDIRGSYKRPRMDGMANRQQQQQEQQVFGLVGTRRKPEPITQEYRRHQQRVPPIHPPRGTSSTVSDGENGSVIIQNSSSNSSGERRDAEFNSVSVIMYCGSSDGSDVMLLLQTVNEGRPLNEPCDMFFTRNNGERTAIETAQRGLRELRKFDVPPAEKMNYIHDRMNGHYAFFVAVKQFPVESVSSRVQQYEWISVKQVLKGKPTLPRLRGIPEFGVMLDNIIKSVRQRASQPQRQSQQTSESSTSASVKPSSTATNAQQQTARSEAINARRV